LLVSEQHHDRIDTLFPEGIFVLAAVNWPGGQAPHVVMGTILIFDHGRYYRTYHCRCKALADAGMKTIL
jgi:hypothetical protein